MKSKIFAIAMFFLAFTTLSSFAPNNASSATNAFANDISSEKPSATVADVTNPKADKKAKRMQKLLNSKAGKWLLAKVQKGMEKRHERLSKKLATAEKAGDTKKVDKIKKQMNAKAGDLKKLATILIVGGLILMLVGIVLGSGTGYGLGGVGVLALVIGLVILLLMYMDVI